MVKQLELIPRKRTALEEDDEEVLRVRLPKKVAEAVAADPEGAAQHLVREAASMQVPDVSLKAMVEALNHDERCMPWESKHWPPMAGYWEVTDHKTGTLLERWWFTGAHWERPEVDGEAREMMGIPAFMASYAWRGLKEMPAEGYPIPPYRAQMFSWRFPEIAQASALAPIGSGIVLPIPFYGAAKKKRTALEA